MEDKSLYVFNTGYKNGELLDIKTERNIKDDFETDKTLEMWADSAYKELVGKIVIYIIKLCILI